jgi:DNA-binding transcriptional MerR regulator
MKIKEVADLAGISVRTLHHYDDIGLLTPQINDAGYRIYSNQDLEQLQQILFFRELGFPLKKIREIIHRPSFDRLEALELQRNMLLEERSRMDKMIGTIEKTIQHKKGEMDMSDKEKFAGFDFSSNPYEQEARRRWGDEAVDEANAKLAGSQEFQEEFNRIYRDLAAIRHEDPASDKAQEGIKEWYDFLNKIGNYSPDAFAGLGQMYVADERFTKNIDQFGAGLAVFMCEAMAVYARENRA